MRPVHLVLEGFGAFRERAELDFDGVDFFALVGPTGSGKSTVIDAICFALYGSVPRYDDRRVVGTVVTTGALEAKVSLTFDLGDERWRATRVVRRTNVKDHGAAPKGTTKEARLERVLADGTTVVDAGNVDELDARIPKLLGLGFDDFTRCVALPQGEFARFLRDKPRARQDLLATLLGFDVYNTVRQLARTEAETARARSAVHRQRLEQLAGATPEALAAAEAQERAAQALHAAFEAAAPELDRLAAEARAADETARAAEARLARLAAVRVPPDLDDLAAAIEVRRAAVAAAEAEHAEAEAASTAADEALAGLPDRAVLATAARAHRDLADARAAVAAAERELAAAEQEATAAAEAAAVAVAEAESAAAALAEAERADMAAALAEHLHAGEQCPVCDQPVRSVPTPRLVPALDDARTALAARREAAATAEAAAKRARTAADGLAGRHRAAVDAVARLEHAVAEHPDPDALAELREQVDAAVAAAEAIRKAEAAARKRVAAARTELAAAEQAAGARWAELDAQRDPLAGDGAPAPDRSDLPGSWAALAEWAAAERPATLEAAEDAKKEADERRRAHADRLAALAEQAAAAGVAVGRSSSFEALRDGVVRAAANASAAVERLRAEIQEVAALTAEVAAATEAEQVADTLHKLLDATGFERWLVSEALDVLVAGASATLERLSAGAFGLARDERNELLVVDHRNADATRSARSLSGGETFQASLALALALADQVSSLAAAGAHKLEAIFLDEGFGTLDADTLAIVADTVEALGAEDRMVGVVTHVRELAERVPVRFEVGADARTATVERVVT